MENIFKKRTERLAKFQKSVRNKIQSLKKEIPEDIFKKCDKCETTISYNELKENLFVCSNCGHHLKVSAYLRIDQIVDKHYFKEINSKYKSLNEDEFEGYTSKLEQYQSTTGLNEAVVTGFGNINNIKTAIAVMDSNFMMGSMGKVVGEKLTRLIEEATKRKLPLIIFSTSGGARMQEGIISLMQMSKTSAALKRHSDKKLLYISVLTNPTTGGVSASFATLGDIIIAEPNALIGFAGKRVIEKTINETLPDNFQKAEFLLEKGFVDKIVHRHDLKETIAKILTLHKGGN